MSRRQRGRRKREAEQSPSRAPSGLLPERWWAWAPVALSAVAFLLAVPFRAHIPLTWDGVQFTLALKQFNILLHQPHPPGYFLFVMVGRLLRPFFAEPFGALALESMLAGSAAVGVTYLVGRELGGRRVGLTAAVLLLTSATAWNARELGETYALAALYAPALVWCCWRQLRDPQFPLWPGALLLGVAVGFRQLDAVLLAPLWLWSMRGRRWSARAAALGWFAVAFGAWFLPMCSATGGYRVYQAATRMMATNWVLYQSPWTSGWPLFWNNVGLIGRALYLGGAPALVLALGYALYRLIAQRSWPRPATTLIALWVLPSLAFYCLVHAWRYGYTMAMLPAGLIVAALALRRISASGRFHFAAPLLLAGMLAFNLCAFFGRELPYDRESEHAITGLARAVAPLDNEHTLFLYTVADPRSPLARQLTAPEFRQTMYSLPHAWHVMFPLENAQYLGAYWNAGQAEQTYILPSPHTFSGIEQIVLWDQVLRAALPNGTPYTFYQLSRRHSCCVIPCDPNRPVTLGPSFNLRFTPAQSAGPAPL